MHVAGSVVVAPSAVVPDGVGDQLTGEERVRAMRPDVAGHEHE